MTATQKLEKDPYYKTGAYLMDIIANLEDNKIDKVKKIINDARLFDEKYYEGHFPRYNEIAEILVEFGKLDLAKDILLEVKAKSKDFYKRAYLDVYEINKKLNLKEENMDLLKEASREDNDSFFDYGYKKLIEILIENEEYEKALKVLLAAKNKQIQKLPEEMRRTINSMPSHKRNEFFPSFEDYRIYKEIIAKIREKNEQDSYK